MPVCVGDMAVVVGRGLFFPGGKDGRGHKDNKMAVCVRVANGSVALFDERAIQYLADGEDPVVYNNCDRVIAYIPDVPKETDVDFDARSREWPPTKLIDPLTGLPWQCYGIVSDLPEGPYGARCLVRYTDMPARADFQSPDEPFGFVSSNPETMLPMDYIRHEGCL